MKQGSHGDVRSSLTVVDRDDLASQRERGNRPRPHARRRVTPAERQKLLFDWNQTRTEYPRDRCLHQLIEAQAERTPEAVAVESEGNSLTYCELNSRANRLAHQLRSFGVRADVMVGICLEPSADLLIALLGVMKAGGAYVPLDASYPKERLTFMVRDSGMRIVITQEKLKSVFSNDEVTILCLESSLSDDSHLENPTVDITPEKLAYVIYTSGSTGRPKGVMVTHGGLVNYLTWAVEAYEVEKGGGAPVHSSISFDLTITGLFAPLLVGRRSLALAKSRGARPLITERHSIQSGKVNTGASRTVVRAMGRRLLPRCQPVLHRRWRSVVWSESGILPSLRAGGDTRERVRTD